MRSDHSLLHVVILNAETQYRAIQGNSSNQIKVALYLAYHLTRQTICGFGFS